MTGDLIPRRKRLAAALLLLGLLVTGATVLVAYLARTVLDERAFSSRVDPSVARRPAWMIATRWQCSASSR